LQGEIHGDATHAQDPYAEDDDQIRRVTGAHAQIRNGAAQGSRKGDR
jgi:hypothetical protein